MPPNIAADILPSATPIATLFTQGKLPQTALFNSTTPVTGNAQLDAALAVPANPVFALGFGKSNLITNDYRLSYVLDAVNNPDGAVPTPQAGCAAGCGAREYLAPGSQGKRYAQLGARQADVAVWG